MEQLSLLETNVRKRRTVAKTALLYRQIIKLYSNGLSIKACAKKLNTDKNKIKTIIFNTLENAMKYSSNSAIISIRTQEVGKRVEVYIQNYNEQFENIDYSSPIMKSSEEGKGEGFGLYIAMEYAKDTKTTMRVFKDYANLVTSEIKIPIVL